MILAFDKVVSAIRASLRPSPSWRDAYAAAMAARAFRTMDRGRLDEAEARSLYALRISPTQGDALAALGGVQLRRADRAGAAESFARAVSASGLGARALAELAARAFARGELANAEALADRALARESSNASALLVRGRVLASRGDFAGAAEALARGARVVDDAVAWTQLGAVYRELGRTDDARACYERALRLAPGYADLHVALGELHLGTRRMNDARACFTEALRVSPDSLRARTRLAAIAALEGNDADAERLLAEARAIAPGDIDALLQQAELHRERGRVDQALECCRRANAIDPVVPEVHMQAAMVHLQRGDFTSAWQEFEWRLRLPAYLRLPATATPPWRGEDLRGRTVHVQYEPGLSDSILFARFLAPLAQRGAGVVVETHPALLRLVGRMAGITAVPAGSDDARTAMLGADCRVPLMSLPHRMRMVREDDPGAAYLFPDRERAAAWRRRIESLPGARRIGWSWFDPSVIPGREVAPEDIEALRGENASFVALDGVPDGRDTRSIVDWSAELADLADVADLIAALDLLVAPPNAFAHLAAALGKEVWVLLPARSDWRWDVAPGALPWYPSARVFRKSTPGERTWITASR